MRWAKLHSPSAQWNLFYILVEPTVSSLFSRHRIWRRKLHPWKRPWGPFCSSSLRPDELHALNEPISAYASWGQAMGARPSSPLASGMNRFCSPLWLQEKRFSSPQGLQPVSPVFWLTYSNFYSNL
uniref:Uncharacterized protein n=1 Tax=mine drainage metagenome TaxID=410659 RepID=E6QIS5_9ZZZZ